MGFNLYMFFEELNAIINHEDLEELSKDDLVRLLNEYVQTQREYAGICGQLK
jgi:hypothetical protein